MNPETHPAQVKNCQSCKNTFEIQPRDFEFYAKMEVPPPTWCPECRFARRLVWRNERGLYKRKCDSCQEDRIFVYPQSSPYKVYCRECWWSDKWEGTTSGREYDFTRPFFSQFADLMKDVPRTGIIKQGNNVNSEYTNRVTDLRNCYLVFATYLGEDSMYSTWINDSKNTFDSHATTKSEQCYECIDCTQCSKLFYSRECTACVNSWFLFNCRNVTDSFGCTNLRNKKYCIFNEQYSKEEYEKTIAEYQRGGYSKFLELKKKFDELVKTAIVPHMVSLKCNDVTGNWNENSTNLRDSYNCKEVENAAHCFAVVQSKDIMDYTFWGKPAEMAYECSSAGYQVSNSAFVVESWSGLTNVRYSLNCHGSSDLFGCIGLRNKQYCILNKQYTKEEYEALVPKIKEQMMQMPYKDSLGRTYGYGEFFPPELSPFAYNESLAEEFVPLGKEKAVARGYAWKEPEIRNYTITRNPEDLPNHTSDISDAITNEVIGCAHKAQCDDSCTTAFRIVPLELAFYRQMNLPLPRLCPNCRHHGRTKTRNPMKLWKRSCMCDYSKRGNTAPHPDHSEGACPNSFETSYAPERPEIVYCEQCYQAEVA